jgi:hypothetical protein
VHYLVGPTVERGDRAGELLVLVSGDSKHAHLDYLLLYTAMAHRNRPATMAIKMGQSRSQYRAVGILLDNTGPAWHRRERTKIGLDRASSSNDSL